MHSHVSQLRRLLEPERAPRDPARVLLTRPPGYLVDAGPETLDVLRFEQLLAEGPAAAGDRRRRPGERDAARRPGPVAGRALRRSGRRGRRRPGPPGGAAHDRLGAPRNTAGYYPDPRDPDETLALVGLDAQRHVRARAVSGGQRRRLDVALGHRGAARAAVPRRADDRVRPAGPPGVLGPGAPAGGRGHPDRVLVDVITPVPARGAYADAFVAGDSRPPARPGTQPRAGDR